MRSSVHLLTFALFGAGERSRNPSVLDGRGKSLRSRSTWKVNVLAFMASAVGDGFEPKDHEKKPVC